VFIIVPVRSSPGYTGEMEGAGGQERKSLVVEVANQNEKHTTRRRKSIFIEGYHPSGRTSFCRKKEALQLAANTKARKEETTREKTERWGYITRKEEEMINLTVTGKTREWVFFKITTA